MIARWHYCNKLKLTNGEWMVLLDGTVPSTNSLLDGPVPSTNSLLDGTVPSTNSLLDGSLKKLNFQKVSVNIG